MSFPRYPKYKDGGVDWLGQVVPAHWEIVMLGRLRFLCQIATGDKDTEDATDEGTYPFYVRSQTVERLDSFTVTWFPGRGHGTDRRGWRRCFRQGIGAALHHHAGATAPLLPSCIDNNMMVYVLSGFQQVSGRFLFHYLRENFYKVALEGGAKSTVDSLRRPDVQANLCGRCATGQRRTAAIVAFLDRSGRSPRSTPFVAQSSSGSSSC